MKNLLEQLQQLAPLAAQATEGPWKIDPQFKQVYSPKTGSFISTEEDEGDNPQDAAFIAAARNLLTPANLKLLVAALQAERTAQKDLDTLRSMLCCIGVVGDIDGHRVIRRDSVIEITDRFRHV